MKFTIGELLEIKDNLNKLSQIKDIPSLTGYRIATLVRKFFHPIQDADAARNNLIRKYAGPPNEVGQVQVTPENFPKFITELNELFAEEVDLDIREIKLPEDVTLPDASTLIGLDRFITV
jgi:hypothetical protein